MPLHSESIHSPSPASLSHARIKDLLGCNNPLLDAEKKALHSLVAESPSALAVLDQQIIEARQTLDSLVQKRQLVQSDFDDAKTILHSMRSIPPEVLKEIFGYCVPDWEEMMCEPLGPGYDSLDPRRPPWTISHVSRAWRDISLSHPRLWACIKLDFQKYEALNMRAVMTKVALLLERSKNMDLSVALLSPKKSLSDHPAFALLDLSAPRWRKLASCTLWSCLQALSGTSFNRLQDLLALAVRTNRDAGSTQVNTFQGAPSLRVVTVLGPETCDSFPLSWSSIETYDCDFFSRGHWDCLKKLTALKSLVITSLIHTTSNPSDSEPPQTTLPTVTSLRISEDCDLGTGIIAKLIENNTLILPSLSTLDFQFQCDSIPSFPLSHHLPTSLTTLIIRDAMESPESIQRVLQFLETVSHVDKLVIDGRCGSEFLRGLSIQPETDVILPNLRILQLKGDRRPFPDPVVLEFLESRCRRTCDDGRHEAAHEENHNARRPRWVFLEEIDLSKVELVPHDRNRLDDLRQRVRITYTC